MFDKVQNKLLVVGEQTEVSKFLADHPHLIATTIKNDGHALAKMSFRTAVQSAEDPILEASRQWPTLTFVLHWLGSASYGTMKVHGGQENVVKAQLCSCPQDYEYDLDSKEILEIWNQDLNRHLVVHKFDRSVG